MIRCCAVAATLAVALPALPSAAVGASAGRDARLRGLLSQLVTTAKAPGGVLLVQTAAGTWRGSVGASRIAPRQPMRATARFRVASVTKPFTAVVVLGLVADGILSLEDTVERWLPGRLPDGAGSRMTIRMLLGHRSGLVNAGSGSGPITVVGAPGSFRYANGNYELLGAIVEAATGSTFGEQLAARVLRPLALTHTELPSSSLPIARLAHGYSPAVVRTGGPRLDLTAVASGLSAPAAGLVSSADDLAAFAAALFGGDLVPRGLFTAMATAGDVGGSGAVGYSAYGLGLMRFNSPCGDAWGHRGRTLGYTAYLLATADGRRTVIALLNDGELPDPLTLRVDALVTRALCA